MHLKLKGDHHWTPQEFMYKNRPGELDEFIYIFGQTKAQQETLEYKYCKIELGEFRLVPYSTPLVCI
jgi:hypothetical protein